MHGHGRRTQAWKTAKVGPPMDVDTVGGLGHDMVFTHVLPWDCMEHDVACMVEKGDGGGSNEMSLGRQGRVSAEARVRSGRLRQGAAAAMALAPGQAGPRERGGTRSLRIPRNAPCCATRYSR